MNESDYEIEVEETDWFEEAEAVLTDSDDDAGTNFTVPEGMAMNNLLSKVSMTEDDFEVIEIESLEEEISDEPK